MQYVQAYWSDEWQAYWTNPQEYLDQLPRLLPQLPDGARAYSSATGHYDFYSSSCVKDLKLSQIEIPHDKVTSLRIHFAPNPFKHDSGLTITYMAVTSFDVECEKADGLVGLGDVMLDEVLPNDSGCTHEIAFHSGRIKITCSDLSAKWEKS
ncbi:hypothetical protein GCM10009799_33070 [Nocardiopsis rhodophaea]|uniref:Uncharacterized protein n=1 Tax=Nocardiopsis rhodophaea TaxID=280238 RepID=A0ABP5ERK3_9ACTN